MPRRNKKELEQLFERSGIDYSKPGFYDTPEFMEAEKEYPSLLTAYAEYVERLQFCDEYLQRARQRSLEAAEFLFKALENDGRKGACIDVSSTLQRFLEHEEIWSYLVCGGVRVRYPQLSGLDDTWFHPVTHPNNPAKAGHAWLRVPPFMVIDVSLPLQPYTRAKAAQFKGTLAAEGTSDYEVVAEDLFEHDFVKLFVEREGKRPTLDDRPPSVQEVMQIFPAFTVQYQRLRVNYIPTKITAMDGNLGSMRNLCLSGKYPAELYEEFSTI